MNYIGCSVNPDGVRAQEIVEALAEDIQDELGHAQRFAQRIKELYGVVPGSMEFTASQSELQPTESQTDIVHVIKGVIAVKTGWIDHYNRIIETANEVDRVTQDMAIDVLRVLFPRVSTGAAIVPWTPVTDGSPGHVHRPREAGYSHEWSGDETLP